MPLTISLSPSGFVVTLAGSLRDGDKAIAATAMAKGHGITTRNLDDFRHAGVPLVNPFDPGTWDEDWDDDPISALPRT